MPRHAADRVTLALTIAGLLIAGYLTALHYDSSIPLACSAGSFVNCESVLTSPSATVFGVPVAVWGLVWFAVALAFAAALLRTDDRAGDHGDDRGDDRGGAATIRGAALAWTAVGTAGVLYLVYQEFGVIGKICAWCTGVHVIIIAMLIVQALGMSARASVPVAVE